jgi:hypothetical protein
VPGQPNTPQLRIHLGRDSTGRVRHRHTTVHGSRRVDERELARLVAEQTSSPEPAPGKPTEWGPTTTVNDAIAGWRDNCWEDHHHLGRFRPADVSVDVSIATSPPER